MTGTCLEFNVMEVCGTESVPLGARASGFILSNDVRRYFSFKGRRFFHIDGSFDCPCHLSNLNLHPDQVLGYRSAWVVLYAIAIFPRSRSVSQTSPSWTLNLLYWIVIPLCLPYPANITSRRSSETLRIRGFGDPQRLLVFCSLFYL